MRRRQTIASVLIGPALAAGVLAGCSSKDDSASSSSSSSSSSSASSSAPKVTVSDLNKVKVSGKPGSSMKVDYDGVFGVKKFSRKILTTGKGTTASSDSMVTVKYSAVNGSNKKVVDQTSNNTPATFALSTKQGKGLSKALQGVKVGSRVVAAVPPSDLFGSQGNQGGSVGGKDTVIFVMDLMKVQPARAQGTKVTPPSGLPTVKLDSKGAPTITMPKSTAPKKLVSQTLIQGTGATVKSTDMVYAHYTGAIWRNGKVFDSSWKNGAPASFQLNQVVPGWKKGLAGKKVGSQVLLVIPPSDGYGSQGQAQAGIKGTDTLVFVVDILAARAAS